MNYIVHLEIKANSFQTIATPSTVPWPLWLDDEWRERRNYNTITDTTYIIISKYNYAPTLQKHSKFNKLSVWFSPNGDKLLKQYSLRHYIYLYMALPKWLWRKARAVFLSGGHHAHCEYRKYIQHYGGLLRCCMFEEISVFYAKIMYCSPLSKLC